MMILQIFLIVLGIGLLYVGGELLVKYAIRLARLWGLSTMVIGLTVVSIGTSSPELAACVYAAAKGFPQISLGNVIGSNVANIGLILGVSGLIYILVSEKLFLRREMPFMIFTSALILPFYANDVLGRFEGVILILLTIFFFWWVLNHSQGAPVEPIPELEEPLPPTPLWVPLVGITAGIALLALGANSLVEGATAVARAFGVPDRVIGLTLVAFGTSLPELASCAVAAWRKETDIVLGNLIGSNILNVVFILGVTALVSPIPTPMTEMIIDYGVMMTFSILLWLFMSFGQGINRYEAGLLLIGYLGYVSYLFMGSSPVATPMP